MPDDVVKAVRTGDLDNLRKLLRNGTEIDARDDLGMVGADVGGGPGE